MICSKVTKVTEMSMGAKLSCLFFCCVAVTRLFKQETCCPHIKALLTGQLYTANANLMIIAKMYEPL